MQPALPQRRRRNYVSSWEAARASQLGLRRMIILALPASNETVRFSALS